MICRRNTSDTECLIMLLFTSHGLWHAHVWQPLASRANPYRHLSIVTQSNTGHSTAKQTQICTNVLVKQFQSVSNVAKSWTLVKPKYTRYLS